MKFLLSYKRMFYLVGMTQEVAKAFEEQRKINFMLAKDKSIEVDGYSGFV